MKRYVLLLSIFITALSLSGCKKDQAATQAKIDDEEIQLYLKTNNITNMIKDPTGFYYRILIPGTGPYPVGPTVTTVASTIQIGFTGSFLNGQVFQAYDTENTLVNNSPLIGFQIATTYINKGGRIQFILPSALAYGPDGDGSGIPPHACLIFTVDMIGFY